MGDHFLHFRNSLGGNNLSSLTVGWCTAFAKSYYFDTFCACTCVFIYFCTRNVLFADTKSSSSHNPSKTAICRHSIEKGDEAPGVEDLMSIQDFRSECYSRQFVLGTPHVDADPKKSRKALRGPSCSSSISECRYHARL